jgi:hypothetical protein
MWTTARPATVHAVAGDDIRACVTAESGLGRGPRPWDRGRPLPRACTSRRHQAPHAGRAVQVGQRVLLREPAQPPGLRGQERPPPLRAYTRPWWVQTSTGSPVARTVMANAHAST